MADPTLEPVLEDSAAQLRRLGRSFALVGGLAVTLRAEARFTRDIDLAVLARDDAEVDWLVQELRVAGYAPVALVEHLDRKRLATVRLASRSGVVVDLVVATSGIEPEVIARATPIAVGNLPALSVARAEELLAMKVLSMSERRPQDRLDAAKLITLTEGLDLDAVREDLALITARGFHRDQDLMAKLDALLASVRSSNGP